VGEGGTRSARGSGILNENWKQDTTLLNERCFRCFHSRYTWGKSQFGKRNGEFLGNEYLNKPDSFFLCYHYCKSNSRKVDLFSSQLFFTLCFNNFSQWTFVALVPCYLYFCGCLCYCCCDQCHESWLVGNLGAPFPFSQLGTRVPRLVFASSPVWQVKVQSLHEVTISTTFHPFGVTSQLEVMAVPVACGRVRVSDSRTLARKPIPRHYHLKSRSASCHLWPVIYTLCCWCDWTASCSVTEGNSASFLRKHCSLSSFI